MDYIFFSLGAMILTSFSTILSKIGLKSINSHFATLIKTCIVFFTTFIVIILRNDLSSLFTLGFNNVLFLALSSICTCISWLSYFKAIQIGEVNKVVVIDKSSFIFSMFLFMIFFFSATTNNGNPLTIFIIIISCLMIFIANILFIDKKKGGENIKKSYILYAFISSISAAFTSLFIKLGVHNVDPFISTCVRTFFVSIFSLIVVLIFKAYKDVSKIDKKSWLYLIIASIFTTIIFVLENAALKTDHSPLVVNAISKSSIFITIIFSSLFLKEKISKKAILGLFLILIATVLIVIFSI